MYSRGWANGILNDKVVRLRVITADKSVAMTMLATRRPPFSALLFSILVGNTPETVTSFGTLRRFSSVRKSHIMSSSDPVAEIGLPTPLLLGSASFTRKLILKEMGVSFVKCVRTIDEKALGDRSQDTPHDLVLTLAQAKMKHLVSEIQAGHCQEELVQAISQKSGKSDEWIVLTGDQVVTCGGDILEKPESIEEAKQFVARYATDAPSTVGSCVLTHLPSGISVHGVDTATIHFSSNIPHDLVDQLLAEDAPVLSCAGGLMVEHPLVKQTIVNIDGTEDSVMGLSKDLVLKLLKDLNEKLEQ